MSGQAWKYSDQLDDMDLKMMKRDFFTYKIGMDYYGFSIRPLMRIAREAGAFYKIGKIVLINRECFDAYLRKTRCNDTYRNNIKSVHIPSEEGECQNRVGRYEGIDDYAATKELIKEHIEYDVLMQDYPSNQELVQGIFELILETVLYTGNKVIIASNEYPAEIVKNRFMKINYMHIQYVMECLRKNTTQVKNIKKYLLAALFNAPVTMQGYYQAEVNHAMPQFANNK